MKRGADISNHNAGLDYTTLSKSLDFVIIQSSYGTTKNPLFMTHYNGCKAAKIPIQGLYHFIYATTNAQAKKNAEKAIQCAQQAGLPKDAYIWCDLEYDTIEQAKAQGVNLGARDINLFTQIFCEAILAAGYKTGFYANGDYYENYYSQETLDKYPLWYCDIDGRKEPKHPCMIWQYTWDGKVKGSDDELDLDYLMDEGAETDPVDKVLAIAEAEIGYHEKNNGLYLNDKEKGAGNGNYTKFGKEMHEIAPETMDYPAAWCDAFVDWCFVQAFGVEKARRMLCGGFDDYTVASADLYKKAGRWTKTAKRGRQIFFQNSGGICHTGLVTKVSGGKVYTIEGNKSNMVKSCSYSITDSSIDGYGMPLYDDAEESQKEDGDIVLLVDTVRMGSKGKSTLLMQKILRSDGYKGKDGKDLALDGEAGTNTIYALKAYQRARKLEVDGICGAKTWSSLTGL